MQGTTLVMVAYAHDKETGAPLFYLASGELASAPDLGELVYKFEGSLYRFDFGPCITCNWANWDTSMHAQRAGAISLYFDRRNHVSMVVTMENGLSKQESLKRFSFGHSVYNLPFIATDQLVDRYFSDLRGEWVFVEQAVGSGTVWRFIFDTVEYPASFTGSIFGFEYTGTQSVVFHDESRNSALVCVSQACGLIQNGTTLASFDYQDIAQDSMFGYIPPADPDAEYETGHHVIGLRVPDLTPAIPPPDAE